MAGWITALGPWLHPALVLEALVEEVGEIIILGGKDENYLHFQEFDTGAFSARDRLKL